MHDQARMDGKAERRLCISVDQDGLTKGYQIAIEERDAKGNGTGTRLAGPKYSGTGRNIMRAYLDERAANDIRRYLDEHFPAQPKP